MSRNVCNINNTQITTQFPHCYSELLVYHTLMNSLSTKINAWIVNRQFEISYVIGEPFDNNDATTLHTAYIENSINKLIIEKHEEAFCLGRATINIQHRNKSDYITLISVVDIHKNHNVVGFLFDSTEIVDIYNQLMHILENSYSPGKNKNIRVAVNNILQTDFFKQFSKSLGGFNECRK